jgi:tRNA pseudouridine55 synthase
MNATRTRVQRRPVHGVLLLDKPLGLSSNDALQKVKWLLRAEKAGHTGTLDPLATGVLPLCFGAATKFSQLQPDIAVARLGQTTTTADAEGEVLRERAVDLAAITPAVLAQVQARFTGPIQQVPPMYSALKKDGKALYEYARAGIEIERPARDVTIHALDIVLCKDADGCNALQLTVTCSKGTYIRTLAEDVGEALGCGAHLRSLRRTDTGGIGVDQCITLDALIAMPEEQRMSMVQPADCLLHAHTRVMLDASESGRFLTGLRRRGDWPDAEAVAIYGDEPRALLGVGHIKSGELIPDRLLSPLEIQQILEGTPRPQDRGILETV